LIEKINHKDIASAQQMYLLFQASYKVEAALLKAENFPPLNRTVADFMKSDTEFYALLKNDRYAVIAEITIEDDCTAIDSLVVHPNYFRQGLGMQLMLFIISEMDSDIFVIETGLDNKPAISLYKKLGFREVSKWDTPFGIRKIKLKKTRLEQ
jgi:ribosomal protein S18 acetylase RimI-like enzyme